LLTKPVFTGVYEDSINADRRGSHSRPPLARGQVDRTEYGAGPRWRVCAKLRPGRSNAEWNGPDGAFRALARASGGLALAEGDGAGRALAGSSLNRTLDRGRPRGSWRAWRLAEAEWTGRGVAAAGGASGRPCAWPRPVGHMARSRSGGSALDREAAGEAGRPPGA
jgi:hypothetical protein